MVCCCVCVALGIAGRLVRKLVGPVTAHTLVAGSGVAQTPGVDCSSWTEAMAATLLRCCWWGGVTAAAADDDDGMGVALLTSGRRTGPATVISSRSVNGLCSGAQGRVQFKGLLLTGGDATLEGF